MTAPILPYYLRPENDITIAPNWLPSDPITPLGRGPSSYETFLTSATARLFCTISQQFADETRDIRDGAARTISFIQVERVLAYIKRFREDGVFVRDPTREDLPSGPPSDLNNMVILMDYVDGVIEEIWAFMRGFNVPRNDAWRSHYLGSSRTFY